LFLNEALRAAEARCRVLEEALGGAECRSGGGLRRAIEEAVAGRGFGFIGEFKRCRPGRFVEYMDPWRFLEATRGCVDAYSVLVEPCWFCGSPELIPFFAPHAPVLFKDFIVCRGQLLEAACWGASGVLLILDALGWRRLDELYSEATGLGLDVLIETGSAVDAVEAAGSYPGALIGINARDLRSLSLSFERLLGELRRAREMAPADTLLVAESGVGGVEDIARAVGAGADAVLVGTSLMRDPGLACRAASMGLRGSS